MVGQLASPATLLHIEDDTWFGCALFEQIKTWPEVLHLGVAETASLGVELCRRHRPRIVLLDHYLPDGCGHELIEEISGLSEALRILLVSGNVAESTLLHLRRRGVSGIIPKAGFTLLKLRAAISNLLAGHMYYPDEIRAAMVAWRTAANSFHKILSDRELSLLPLLGRGDSDEEIAALAGIVAASVKSHRQHIMNKLGIKSTSKLMCWAAEKGFVRFFAKLPGQRAS